MDVERSIAWYQAQLDELNRVAKAVDMARAPNLNDAFRRLAAFRSTWNDGDAIDQESGLTADDLDIVIAFTNEFQSSD